MKCQDLLCQKIKMKKYNVVCSDFAVRFKNNLSNPTGRNIEIHTTNVDLYEKASRRYTNTH